jgi:hypothetical protein
MPGAARGSSPAALPERASVAITLPQSALRKGVRIGHSGLETACSPGVPKPPLGRETTRIHKYVRPSGICEGALVLRPLLAPAIGQLLLRLVGHRIRLLKD